MNESELEQLESRLTGITFPQAPALLRERVVRDVHRELRAARWDRRLGRLAASLLVVGVGLNLAALRPGSPSVSHQRSARQTPARIAELATDIANLTDAETGRRYALHLAALSGWSSQDPRGMALESEIDKQL